MYPEEPLSAPHHLPQNLLHPIRHHRQVRAPLTNPHDRPLQLLAHPPPQHCRRTRILAPIPESHPLVPDILQLKPPWRGDESPPQAHRCAVTSSP